MHRRGPNAVRGWRYCRERLTGQDLADIECNIREMLDLCRRCGRPGHFASACRNRVDRKGDRIV